MSKLTEKQKVFADLYIETLNAKESAIRAGYSKKTASVIAAENLNKPSIRNYIDERMQKKENKRIASQDEVLEALTRIARGEELEEMVAFGSDGEDMRTVKTPSIKERTRAWELLGKRYRLFVERVEKEDTSKIKDGIIDEMLEGLKNEL